MAQDQVRDERTLRHPTTGLLKDNTTGFITPQTARDQHVSSRDFARLKSYRFGTSSTGLTIDCARGDTQEIQLNHSITALNFTNRRPVNLIWPNTDLQHSNWLISSATTITAAFGTGPTGNVDAYRVQMPTGLNTATRIAFDAILNQPYTAMIWVKENGVGSQASIGFSNTASDQTQFGQPISPTALWARYSYPWAGANGTGVKYLQFDNQANATSMDVLVWRPQLYASDVLPDDQIFEDTLFDATSGPFGEATYLTLILKQDGVGSRTIVWPSNVLWTGGTEPILTSSPNAYDLVALVTTDGGARWFGSVGGQAFG